MNEFKSFVWQKESSQNWHENDVEIDESDRIGRVDEFERAHGQQDCGGAERATQEEKRADRSCRRDDFQAFNTNNHEHDQKLNYIADERLLEVTEQLGLFHEYVGSGEAKLGR